MPIPESFLEEIRYKNNIEDIVSRYVTLKKDVALCPFHTEKTPSFRVFNDTQSYYCFGCGAGGDVITFIRKIENLDYIDAVRHLAQLSGLPMPEEVKDGEATRKQREMIFKINKEAAKFFHQNLMSKEGETGLSYFINRKLKKNIIVRFGLGYAPDGWDNLTNYLVKQGFDKELIRSAGLAISNDKGGFYDRFRNRVIFPIIDVRGNVIGFGGRALDDSTPKYLNSPDTLVFKKSLNLFALQLAKNKNNDQLILSEGYMDVISLHQAGFTNAVATLGTAITSEQARLISRYAKEVVVAYDSDEAGQKAANKAISLLTPLGLDVKVLTFEGGKDPDEYIKTFGAIKFKTLMDGSGSHIEYLINKVRSKFDLNIADDKVKYLKEVAVILSKLTSAVEQEVYIDKVSQETNIDKEKIKIEIGVLTNRKKYKNISQYDIQEMTRKRMELFSPDRRSNIKERVIKAEKGIIAILLKHNDYLEKIRDRLSKDDFITAFNGRIFSLIEERTDENKSTETSSLSQYLEPDEMGKVIGYLAYEKGSRDELSQLNDYIDILLFEKDRVNRDNVNEKSADELNTIIKEKLAASKIK